MPIADVEAQIDDVSVEVDDVAQRATLTVEFTVKDERGDPIPHLGDPSETTPSRLAYLRFALAKLEPAAEDSGDPDFWVSYTRGDRTAANLTDHGDGTYTYVFATNLYSLYDAGRRHRVLLIIFDDIVEQAKNVSYDFVPEQLPGPFAFDLSRDIVTTSACNECHGRLGSPLSSATFHSGTRYTTEGCAVCHTALGDEGEFKFAPFIHKIHSAKKVNDEEDFTEVTFPQDLKNCAKCHAGPDGDHWYTRPSIEACGSCHDDVNFATGENHAGGQQTSNMDCTTCHPANGGISPIIEAHLTETSTPHNPDVPEGLVNFEYVIEEVTVSGDNQPLVKFRILMDGEPVTFKTFSAGATVLIDNFTGSPSFLVAYALPQDGTDTPADYNQLGKAGGQPASVSILNVWNGTQGSLSGPDQDGNYVATLNGPTSGSSIDAARFPAGAQLRAVALQGYFTQVSPASNRYAVSVIEGVTGDAVRREVVEVPKCINCHESLQLHGGNRVNEVQVCVTCHNPNLSSSGRVSDPVGLLNNPNASASAKAATQATVDAVGTDPLVYPEASMNFKSLVHGIHSSAKRNFPFEFVRDRGNSGVFYYDFSEVTFPGVLSDCETCHKPGTYDTDLPENVLVTTDITTDGLGTTRAGLQAARNDVPNDTDLVHSPTAGACYFCHDSNPAAFHYGHNGGVIDTERSEALRGQ